MVIASFSEANPLMDYLCFNMLLKNQPCEGVDFYNTTKIKCFWSQLQIFCFSYLIDNFDKK